MKLNDKHMVQELEKLSLPPEELTKSWRRMKNIRVFQSFPSWVKQMIIPSY